MDEVMALYFMWCLMWYADYSNTHCPQMFTENAWQVCFEQLSDSVGMQITA